MKKIRGETIRQCILTTLCFVGCLVCNCFSDSFLSATWRTVIWIAAILLYAFYLLSELMNWSIPAKFLLSLFLVAVILMALILILVRAGVWEHFQSAESMREFISSAPSYDWMVVIFIAVQFAQVCLIPIPGTVTTAAGTLLFGPILGSVYSFIGIMLGSLAAFLIGRRFGYRFVRWMVGEEDLEKGLKFVKGRDRITFFLIFLLPFFPDDVLCFVAGLTPMSVGWFLLILGISRIVTTLCTAYVVEYVRLLFDMHPAFAIALGVVVITGMVLLFYYGVKYGKQIEEWFGKKFSRRKKSESTSGEPELSENKDKCSASETDKKEERQEDDAKSDPPPSA